MRKYIVWMVVLIAVLLAACAHRAEVLGEPKMYEVGSEIRSLDIQISAADFTIVQAEEFSVESNLKNLTVSEKNGVLTIEEKNKGNVSYTNAVLKLSIPEDIVFEEVKISTGAAKLTADSLSADTMTLKLGAGTVEFGSLKASSGIVMEGGTGKIIVSDGMLHNMELSMGVGEIQLTAALLGKSTLQLGVGEANLTLLGNREDYKLDIQKEIGSIILDGESISDTSSGNGPNHVTIKGGIGTAEIAFQN